LDYYFINSLDIFMSLSILQLAKKRIVLLDGGMGTELIKKGFEGGGPPEAWNIEKPDIVKNIHKKYFDAGSDAVLTNSFGGNKIKLASFGMEKRCSELNKQAAELAYETKPEGKYVGGSMGPTEILLKTNS
jgi:5-methyltetrahydrofolate--homocysteine methyltransferase